VLSGREDLSSLQFTNFYPAVNYPELSNYKKLNPFS
jgi:hypothetical protein